MKEKTARRGAFGLLVILIISIGILSLFVHKNIEKQKQKETIGTQKEVAKEEITKEEMIERVRTQLSKTPGKKIRLQCGDLTNVLETATKQAKLHESKENPIIESLKDELQAKGIYGIGHYHSCVSDDEVIAFYQELLLDEKSQKVFRKFAKAPTGVLVILSDSYKITDSGAVEVDIKDGVEQIAKCLSR